MMSALKDNPGLTPLDYLLGVMNNPHMDESRRIEAAKAACPYVHPKLSNIEMNASVKTSHEDALADLD